MAEGLVLELEMMNMTIIMLTGVFCGVLKTNSRIQCDVSGHSQ